MATLFRNFQFETILVQIACVPHYLNIKNTFLKIDLFFILRNTLKASGGFDVCSHANQLEMGHREV